MDGHPNPPGANFCVENGCSCPVLSGSSRRRRTPTQKPEPAAKATPAAKSGGRSRATASAGRRRASPGQETPSASTCAGGASLPGSGGSANSKQQRMLSQLAIDGAGPKWDEHAKHEVGRRRCRPTPAKWVGRRVEVRFMTTLAPVGGAAAKPQESTFDGWWAGTVTEYHQDSGACPGSRKRNTQRGVGALIRVRVCRVSPVWAPVWVGSRARYTRVCGFAQSTPAVLYR